MNDDLEAMIKYLGLRGMYVNLDKYLQVAGEQNFSNVRFLQYVIEEEFKLKLENARKRRVNHAKMPEEFVIETFPFDRQPKLNQKKIMSIYDAFDFINKHQNIVFIGSTGAGKTGIATSFLMQAVNKGFKGKFILFPELIEQLYQAKADRSEAALIKKYVSYDCLLIDEIGYVETNAAQVGLFFTLMHKRHKAKSTLITSNLGFDQWGAFLKNNQLTAALIDRITENSHVINMNECVSLRSKFKQS
jgi:DNA replication protein DnaC